ncbi:hypothetical protein TcYC6_0029730 [Trypanosoma cruzi]|nr:hypothetical protein TcYC6_0029730 [Trypanosoma cruzi]
MEDYLSEGSVIEKNLPHPWATAHNAYREVRESGRNQTILISGESGAGKTEAAKIVLKYLAALSTKNGTPEDREISIQINKRVLASSPILESFGNAKTVRNDNSSRFGKFLRVQFDKHGIGGGGVMRRSTCWKSQELLVPLQGSVCTIHFINLCRGR